MLGIPEVIVPPHPGITSAVGPADQRPALRRHPHRRSRSRARPTSRASMPTSPPWRRSWPSASPPTASTSTSVTFERRGDLRYVGQGYELRVPFPDGAIDDGGAGQGLRAPSTRSIAASTAITSPSPAIEIVNLRAGRRRPAPPRSPSRRPARPQSLDAARVRERHRARSASTASSPTIRPTSIAATCCRSASASPAPPSSCRWTSTTVVPPQLRLRGRRGGQSDHRGSRDSMSTAPRRQPAAKPDRIDPITTSVIQGALENIAVEMGYKLMRMSYSSIIRESEDFGAALVDAEGRGLAESAQSTPLQSGPIPGYVRGVLQTAGGARRSVPAGRRDHAQRRLLRRQPRAGRRLHRAGVRPGHA